MILSKLNPSTAKNKNKKQKAKKQNILIKRHITNTKIISWILYENSFIHWHNRQLELSIKLINLMHTLDLTGKICGPNMDGALYGI